MSGMRDDERFPADVRELASKANLPQPSWHVGRYRPKDPLDRATRNIVIACCLQVVTLACLVIVLVAR